MIRLTQAEIEAAYKDGQGMLEFARAIESAHEAANSNKLTPQQWSLAAFEICSYCRESLPARMGRDYFYHGNPFIKCPASPLWVRALL